MSLGTRNGVTSPENYVRSAFQAECAIAASTTAGRNDQLNKSAHAIGQLIPSGYVDRHEAEHALIDAAQASGYVAKDGLPAARATIKSGLDEGMRYPRELPANGASASSAVVKILRAVPKLDDVALPDMTPPGEDGKPKFYAIGKDEPTRFDSEARRHVYWRDGQPVRIRIKHKAGSTPPWIAVYRVRRPSDGAIGWQAKKPEGFVPVPYIGPPGSGSPFGDACIGRVLVWAEGEKDVDTLLRRGFLAFTFGSASDVPDCGDLLRSHHVIICPDNDQAGEKSVARKIAATQGATASLKIVRFPELPEGGDATDFFETGATAEDFLDRATAVTAEESAQAVAASAEPGAKGDDLVRVPFKTVSQFVGEYEPLSYMIEPTVRTGSLYTLTAKTGAGKTAWMIAATLAIATGRRDILNLEVERGRVAYCCFENPDDIRMRLAISAFLLNVDLRAIGSRIMILDMRVKPEAVLAELRDLSAASRFSLVFVDTLAAFFDGDNINDAVQGGEFIRRMRPIAQLPGKPAVVVAAHPVKNAAEDQIVPYGSGAILNEVDGNLTLWRKPEGGTVRFHWQGKLRGLEFEPADFRFEVSGCPDILDAKGRQVQIPTMLPAKDTDVEQRAKADIDLSIALLQVMLKEPKSSTRQWADAIRTSQSLVMRRLAKMSSEKLVEKILDQWSVTKKGVKEVEKRA